MVDLVSELDALPDKRPRAPRIRQVLHPSAPSAPLAPFETAQDPIDQLAMYYRHCPKINIKIPFYETHRYMLIFVYIEYVYNFFIYLYDLVDI